MNLDKEGQMKRIALVFLCALLVNGVSTLATGQAPTSRAMDKNSMQMMDSKAASHSATGVVKNLDSAGGSIVLAHEPIKSLTGQR
jgi:Cu/Ag efflux protein CusF